MAPRHTSGDLIADRRYRLGEAYAADGGFDAAADLFAQTLELVPDWAPAWLALGLARERQGDDGAAIAAFRRAADLDPEGALGASVHLARLENGGAAQGMPAAFVRGLFDDYADRFDEHLTHALGYRGPVLILEALNRAGWMQGGPVLDLGCGTGLMARALARHAAVIDGVDLSPNMIAQARASGFYRTLAVADAASFLTTDAKPGAYAFVIAADVLVYVGDLATVLSEVPRVLRPGGLFAFTTQLLDALEGFRLGADMRFSHSRTYVEEALAGAGLDVVLLDEASTREDRGIPVPGLVVVARKA